MTRFVVEGAAVRGACVHLSEASRAILAMHSYPPPLARVLGELLGAATLLASTLKFDGSLILQLQGDGPVKLLVVECDHAMRLRATAQWDGPGIAAAPMDATLAELSGGSAHARLAITLDPRGAGPVYQGIVALQATSVGALIEHYLATSEQLASRIALAVRDGAVGGVLLQRMPGSGTTDDATWERVARRLREAPAGAVLAAGGSNEGLAALLPDEDLRAFRAAHPRFACSCSTERVENALRIAGRHEVEAALEERGEVEVRCEFCNRRYVFAPESALALFATERGRSPTRH